MSYPPPPGAGPPPGGYGPPPGGFGPPPGGYGPPPGGPGGYGAPGGYGGPPVKVTNGLAIASLVTGILAAVTCGWLGFLGLAAIPLGIAGLSRAKKLAGSGKGLAIGGIVTGVLGIVMMALWAGLVWFAADAVEDFGSCVDGTSPAGFPCESQGTSDPDPSRDGINSDPADQICNTDRFLEDPDC